MKHRDVYIDQLNRRQKEAVSHFEGPILVLAGAGSGKTRVLTTRIANLISRRGIPPQSILAVTFTNKAAGEMRDRVHRLLGEAPIGMWLGTFHGLGARFLRQHSPLLGWTSRFSIFNSQDSARLVKSTAKSIGLDTARWSPKIIAHKLSDLKNNLVSPQQYLEENGDGLDIFKRKISEIYPRYQTALKDQNAFDFDDLLVKPVEILRSNDELLGMYQDKFKFLLVDEFQDTNNAQIQFLKLLSHGHENLMVVGDDDQSIYGWRGADVRNILEFEQNFGDAQLVRLEQNYRSSGAILAAANAVIQENTKRRGKTLYTDKPQGELITLIAVTSEKEEAEWIADQIENVLITEKSATASDIAILYRTNAQSRVIGDIFSKKGLPYQIIGGTKFYERREIQDVLAYLRLISNPVDKAAFERVVNYPRKGIGKSTLERLRMWSIESNTSYLESAIRAEEIPGISPRGAASLLQFANLIQKYSSIAYNTHVGELLGLLVEESGIFRELASEGPEGEDRANNVTELIAKAHDFRRDLVPELDVKIDDGFSELDLFLQEIALVMDIDNHDTSLEKITLMTLHSAKGLEFPYVFISGLEDGLFPLHRAYDSLDELEEERRLFYVGITRAKVSLFLTRAKRRWRAGEVVHAAQSTFLRAIPDSLLKREGYLVGRSEGNRTEVFGEKSGDLPGRNIIGDSDANERYDFTEDQEFNQDLPRLVKGEMVSHDQFGSGVISSVSGFGRDLKIEIDFESVGVKRLLARYARLKKDY
jgi:DNA helicase-2/ATP-dependent DNA helicase PcrA